MRGSNTELRSDSWRRNLNSCSGLLAAILISIAIVAGGCGGSGGGSSPLVEGKGDPGDTEYADRVVRPYYVDNDLVDPPAAAAVVLPETVDNTDLLAASVDNSGQLGTLPVANQGEPGICAAVTFAQMVYGADTKAGAAAPLLDNVQYSYMFARYYQEGGASSWKKDLGSFAYTNFEALTNQSYRQDFANGRVPVDGAKKATDIINPTGVFFPFPNSPNLEPITPDLRRADLLTPFWNEMNLWKSLNTGPTQLTMTIRKLPFTPTSLDVKAAIANRNLVKVGISANDAKNQWDPGSQLAKTGVMELPYQPNPNGKWDGHAMLIVGYDDGGYGKYNGAGAFKVRNSWGRNWGDAGYWYMPYSLVDDVAGNPEGGTYPMGYDDNYVYIAQISHN